MQFGSYRGGHGQGQFTMIYKDGVMISGEMDKGKMHGRITKILLDGKMSKQLYEQGNFVKFY